MAQYLPILAMLVLASVFALVSFAATRILNPPRPTAEQVAPYECGIIEQREAPERFPVRFFLVAMVFIVFDIEIIFLYPFALIHRDLGWFGLVDVVVFSATVFFPFVYLVSKGVFDWGPPKYLRSRSPLIDASRTTEGTVRRVGAEGRLTEPEAA